MTEEKVSPLRKRMIEDMRIRGTGDKAQSSYIRAIKDFAAFLARSPDTATPEALRAYQLHMTEVGITPPTFNARITPPAAAPCRRFRGLISHRRSQPILFFDQAFAEEANAEPLLIPIFQICTI